MSIAGEHLTGTQMAERLSAVLGEEVVYVPVPFDVLRAQPFPAAAELGNMFQFVDSGRTAGAASGRTPPVDRPDRTV